MADPIYGQISPERKKRFLKHLLFNIKKYQQRKGSVKRKKFQQEIAKLSGVRSVSEIKKDYRLKPKEPRPLESIERKIDKVLDSEYDRAKEQAFHSKMLSRISEMEDKELSDLKNLKNRASIGTIDVSQLKRRIEELRGAIRTLSRDDHADHGKLKELRQRLNKLETRAGLQKRAQKKTKKQVKKTSRKKSTKPTKKSQKKTTSRKKTKKKSRK